MNRISRTDIENPYIYGIMTVTEKGEVILPHQAYRRCGLGPQRQFPLSCRPRVRRNNTNRRRNYRAYKEKL